MKLTYNDTGPGQDHITFTQGSDGRWDITEENIKKIETLMDLNKALEKELAHKDMEVKSLQAASQTFRERIKHLTSEIKRLDKEAGYWWQKYEMGSL